MDSSRAPLENRDPDTANTAATPALRTYLHPAREGGAISDEDGRIRSNRLGPGRFQLSEPER